MSEYQDIYKRRQRGEKVSYVEAYKARKKQQKNQEKIEKKSEANHE